MAGPSATENPQTSGRSAQQDPALSSIPEGTDNAQQTTRRPSFSFLRRGKSVERLTSRSLSGGKMSKKQREQEKLRQQREATAIPSRPPKIPDIARPPQLQTFGGENSRPDSVAIMSNKVGTHPKGRSPSGGLAERSHSNMQHNVPVPPIPGSKNGNGDYVDPYARTESMTHRGRYSYASSAASTLHSPRRVRRRKDPTPFNILIVGARNSGKSAFLDFLRTSLVLPTRKQQPSTRENSSFPLPSSTKAYPNFTSHYLESEMDGEHIGLTLWDSEGLDKSVVDLQLRDMSTFLESKFEETFTEEMKVHRSPGVQDTHIHCVFLVLDPLRLDLNIRAARKASGTNGATLNGKSFISPPTPPVSSGLDEVLDLQVLRTLKGKTTVIPIISKADTITKAHMAHLKRSVWESLRRANLDPLEALGLDDDESDSESSSNDSRVHIHLERPNEESTPLPPEDGRDTSMTSHLDSASDSDSSSLFVRPKSRKENNPPRPSHNRNDSFPLPSTGLAAQPQSPNHEPSLPLSIISPDPFESDVVGRSFPWGFADPYNGEHCDFMRLRDAVFREWRPDLIRASKEVCYEEWRTTRLNRGPRRQKGWKGREGSTF